MTRSMLLTMRFEQEADGRWIGEIVELPGVLVYGKSREDAARRVSVLALRTVTDRIENGELDLSTVESISLVCDTNENDPFQDGLRSVLRQHAELYKRLAD